MKKFSLMELLVVMGIILLMMSLLLPTVGPMMDRAEMNRIVTTIIGQLEVGYIKSLEKSNVTRVSFENDPVGKNISKQDILTKITFAAAMASEVEDRQNIKFDLNCDGVSGGNCNRQFFWLKVYLCQDKNTFTSLADIRNPLVNAKPVEDGLGPFWLRKPVARVQNESNNFIPSKITMMPIKDDAGIIWYYRPVMNEGLDVGGVEKLLPLDVNNQCSLIEDSAASVLNRSLDIAGMRAQNSAGDPCINTYNKSVALYKGKGGARYQYNVGSATTAVLLANLIAKGLAQIPPVTYTIADLENPSTEWYDIFEGDMVNPNLLDFGKNDDEDKMIDEGMSVAVENFNQSGVMPVVLDFMSTPPILHNNYFSNIEDNNMKIGREYFIGGKEKKGVMLRRVWGEKPGKGKNTRVLLWANDKYLPAFVGDYDKLKGSTPFYFSVVFDQKNGSGMYFCNSFGSTQVGKLFFQVADDDNKITTLIKFEEGAAKEVSLKDMLMESKSDQDTFDYFQGVH